jgi:transposase
MAISRRAVGQVEQGAHPDEVAQALGMTQAAVYAWLAKYREGGLEALHARLFPDRHRDSRARSLPACTGWWATTAASCGSRLRCGRGQWSVSFIGREFGVRLSEVSVGRLLRKLGLSPQRPLYRAKQQNPRR